MGQVNAVNGERLSGLGVQFERRLIEVHERDVIRFGNFRHRFCIECDAFVVLDAVGQITVVQIFMADGGEQDQTRMRFAVVLLARVCLIMLS